jgi:hypothetical protein
MFAPDHGRAAAELTRVSRPSGRIAMTILVNDGLVGELFKLTGSFMPPPPPGLNRRRSGGIIEAHVAEVFSAAGVSAAIARETINFDFPSVEDAVRQYAEYFGPFVMARGALEPENRWEASSKSSAILSGASTPSRTAAPGSSPTTSSSRWNAEPPGRPGR